MISITDFKGGVVPVWQPQGFSTNLISQRIGELYSVKASHTGTLDPMAEGVILVLLDEKRLLKKELAQTAKTYEFDLVLGIETDTLDALGIIKNISPVSSIFVPTLTKGPYLQEIPVFNAYKKGGKPSHLLARSENSIKRFNNGDIIDYSFNEARTISSKNFLIDLEVRINRLKGNFRQKEVLEKWKELNLTALSIVSASVTLTKGLYARAFARDLASSAGHIGIADKIVRIQNGNYKKDDCYKMEELFGLDFETRYDWISRTKYYEI